jgi:hypothetical protein
MDAETLNNILFLTANLHLAAAIIALLKAMID